MDGLWTVDEFEERALSWAYSGPVEKLPAHVAAILAGKEVVVPAVRYDGAGGGPRETWYNQTAYRNLNWDRQLRVWRVRAGPAILSLTEALASRPDFVVGAGSGDREAVPALVTRLKDADASVRAAEELGQVGPEGRDAVRPLTAALDDPAGLVRVRAAEALTAVGGDDAAAAAALGKSLADQAVGIRREAALALWRMGPEAKAAVPALGRALADADVIVRRDAAATLWHVGVPAKAAAADLAGALKDPDRDVRWVAAGALGALGAASPEAAAALPPLAAALKDKDLEVRHFAARALVRLGDQAAREAAAPVLREVLEDGGRQPAPPERDPAAALEDRPGGGPRGVAPGPRRGEHGGVDAPGCRLQPQDDRRGDPAERGRDSPRGVRGDRGRRPPGVVRPNARRDRPGREGGAAGAARGAEGQGPANPRGRRSGDPVDRAAVTAPADGVIA